MSIPIISGVIADPGEENPVSTRYVQIEGSSLQTAVGFPITAVYTNRPNFPSQRQYWQYYTNGMILCDANTCAQVLFGPILDSYASMGQFGSPLGFPSTDVSNMPDGTSFVAFENGVLWLDQQNAIQNLAPLDPLFVKGFSGIDPSPQGIAAFAQTRIQTLAQQQLQSNPQLSSEVSSITATVQFQTTGGRGCQGASFDTMGHSLLRSHIFTVHFDFQLAGCAGDFGSASADMHVTARVNVTQSKVSAFLEGFNIDGVSSPGGLGDSLISENLANAFYAQQGVDLIDQKLPSGVNVLTAIVDEAGNVNVYQEPMCMGNSMLLRVATPEAGATLTQIRQLRDKHLLATKNGQQLVQLFEAAGPILTESIRHEKDSAELRARISKFLMHNFHEHADLAKAAQALTEPGEQALTLLQRLARSKNQDAVPEVMHRVVRFLRDEVRGDTSLHAASQSLSRVLAEESERHKK